VAAPSRFGCMRTITLGPHRLDPHWLQCNISAWASKKPSTATHTLGAGRAPELSGNLSQSPAESFLKHPRTHPGSILIGEIGLAQLRHMSLLRKSARVARQTRYRNRRRHVSLLER
jgi:hypothetical protein